MKTYKARWFSDSGHEWLGVKKSDCVELGITHQITQCSYHKGNYAYLEGDCDAAIFYDAVEKSGGKIELEAESYTDGDGPVRKYPRIRSATAFLNLNASN